MSTLEARTERELTADDVALAAGAALICRSWQFLSERTRSALQRSHCYSGDGHRFNNEEVRKKAYDAISDGIRLERHYTEELELTLGRLDLCVAAKIPSRDDVFKGAEIPLEAHLTDECDRLLLVPDWRDALFLRLALSAVIANGLANSLTSTALGPTPKPSTRFGVAVHAVYVVVMVAICPLAAAYALVAASDHSLVGTSVALYVLAMGISVALDVRRWQLRKRSTTKLGERPTPAEREYAAWWHLRYFLNARGGTAIGAGARFFLEQMALDGIQVPGVAFDICAALQAQSIQG